MEILRYDMSRFWCRPEARLLIREPEKTTWLSDEAPKLETGMPRIRLRDVYTIKDTFGVTDFAGGEQ